MLDEFKSSLLDSSYTDIELVDRFIMFGTPFIFNENEPLYFDLKKEVSNFFGTSINNVLVVGSAKLGFSIAPKKRFRPIQDDSDIDVAIVSDELFDTYWEKLFKFNINLVSRNETEQALYDKFLAYFFRGWLRPDYFPFRYAGKQEWFDFFKSISYKKYDKRKVTGAIYKNEFFFKKYHEANIRNLREVVTHE